MHSPAVSHENCSSSSGGVEELAIEVRNLNFVYDDGTLGLNNINLKVPRGSRVLCIGANGAGKSSLLRILGGKKLVDREVVKVLGRSAFHDTTLISQVTYLADWWTRASFLDVTVAEFNAEHLSDERFQMLARVLGVELSWDIALLSDGQRRRCQLLANLAKKAQLYLLDEVTSDLDLLARENMLQILRSDSLAHNSTILYATHSLDGMEDWATHVLYLRRGEIGEFCKPEQLPGYSEYSAAEVGRRNPLYCALRDLIIEDASLNAERVKRVRADGVLEFYGGEGEAERAAEAEARKRATERHRGVKPALLTFVEDD